MNEKIKKFTWETINPKPSIPTFPTLTIVSGYAFHRHVVEAFPPLQQVSEMMSDMGFKLDDIPLRKNMGIHFPFASMLLAIPGGEDTRLKRDKCVIKVGLGSSTAMCVDNGKSVWDRDRDVVRGNAHNRTW
jgi:hypothetical protein